LNPDPDPDFPSIPDPDLQPSAYRSCDTGSSGFSLSTLIRIFPNYFALYVFQLMKPEGGEVGLCVCGTGLLRVHGSLLVVDHKLANHYDGNYSLDLKKKKKN
jgi:hypothetical protein